MERVTEPISERSCQRNDCDDYQQAIDRLFSFRGSSGDKVVCACVAASSETLGGSAPARFVLPIGDHDPVHRIGLAGAFGGLGGSRTRAVWVAERSWPATPLA